MASTISTSSTDLGNLLKPLCRIAPRKNGGAHGYLLIEVVGESLRVTANNANQQMMLSAPAQSFKMTGEDASYCVPAAKLEQIVSALPRAAGVTLTHSDGKVKVVCGRARFTLLAFQASDFPQMTIEDSASTRLTVDGSVVAGALRQVGFCAARNEARHYLNGVLFEMAPGRLTVAASDGLRLGVVDLCVEAVEDASFILPSSCIEDVALFITSAAGESIELAICSNLVRFTSRAGVLYSTLIDGKFPDYRRLVDAAEKGVPLQINRQDMADSLSRVALLSQGGSPFVRLGCQGESLTVQSVAGDDAAFDVLPCDYTGDPFEVGLQVGLASEIVRALPSDQLRFIYNGASGTLLRPTDFPSHSFVLMPVRL